MYLFPGAWRWWLLFRTEFLYTEIGLLRMRSLNCYVPSHIKSFHIIHLGRTWQTFFLLLLNSISSIKTGSRRINSCGTNFSSLVRLPRGTKMESSSRRITLPVPVFILDEFNIRRKKCFLKFVPDGLCVSSIKTAIVHQRRFKHSACRHENWSGTERLPCRPAPFMFLGSV